MRSTLQAGLVETAVEQIMLGFVMGALLFCAIFMLATAIRDM